MKWKTLGGEKIPDIQKWVEVATREGQSVHIGTDSLQTGKFTQFVTVVAILTPSKGGRVAYTREVVPRITSLRERLLKEVWRSVDLGLELSPILKGPLTIAIDANPAVKYKSSKYIEELVGLVVSQGFEYKVKPDSWAATTAADWIVRHKGVKPASGL